jgi:hypothetical protein
LRQTIVSAREIHDRDVDDRRGRHNATDAPLKTSAEQPWRPSIPDAAHRWPSGNLAELDCALIRSRDS